MCDVDGFRPSEENVINGVKVVYVNHGIATKYDTHIEINEVLKEEKWKVLHDHILEHELKHELGKYNFQDFKIDFLEHHSFKLLKMYIDFVQTNRSSWSHFIPVRRVGKITYVNESQLIYYAFVIIVAVGVFLL